jgi:hypothetical protein
MNDKEFVKKILDGNQSCWEEFVERYTDWVLYTAWEFERKFCRLPARFINCSLLMIMRQRKGEKVSYRREGEDCDEGVELYLWLFQQLRTRLKSYRGKSKLSTYIWMILNSKFLQVDILRWKYGRVDECNEKRLPAAIQELPETERKIFVWLRRGKDEGFILRKLNLDQESFQQGVSRVRETLLRAGQLDIIEHFTFRSLEFWDGETQQQLWYKGQIQEQEKTITDQVFYRQMVTLLGSAVENLKPAEQKLLKLYYHEGLSGKEIGRFCSQLAFPLEIDGAKVNSQNVYYLLGKVTERLTSTVNLDINGQQLSHKQWLKVLSVLGRERIW